MMEAKLLEGRCGEIITAVEARLDRQGRDGTAIAATLMAMAAAVLRERRESADQLVEQATKAFIVTRRLSGLDETDLGWLMEDYKAVLTAMAEDGLLRY